MYLPRIAMRGDIAKKINGTNSISAFHNEVVTMKSILVTTPTYPGITMLREKAGSENETLSSLCNKSKRYLQRFLS